MEIIKIRRKILSPNLRISELKNFIGKYVEITVQESTSQKKTTHGELAAGILSEFKNQEKAKLEKQAWNIAVNEKHGNY